LPSGKPSHVARDGAHHARGVVVLLRAVARRHHPAHQRPYSLTVDEHVDGEHEDEDQPEACRDDLGEQVGAERDDGVGPADDLLLERLEGGVALRLDLEVDALAIEVVLDVGQARVGGVGDRRDVVAQGGDLIGDRVGQQHPGGAQRDDEAQVDAHDGHAAGQVRPLQAGDERIQDERDDRGGGEEQDDRPGRLDDLVADEQDERQRDELDPARNHDGIGRRRRRL
jgi:hypothetical protein